MEIASDKADALLRKLGPALFGHNNLMGSDFADVSAYRVNRDFPQDQTGILIQFVVSNDAVGKIHSEDVSEALATLLDGTSKKE